jgi:hypothetical protein
MVIVFPPMASAFSFASTMEATKAVVPNMMHSANTFEIFI